MFLREPYQPVHIGFFLFEIIGIGICFYEHLDMDPNYQT